MQSERSRTLRWFPSSRRDYSFQLCAVFLKRPTSLLWSLTLFSTFNFQPSTIDLSDHSDLREAILIEKRYFTSDLSSLSYASLTFWIGMTSTSEVMLCAPQKSSISWVSGRPPMGEPERLRRLNRSPKGESASGFSGA